MLNPHQANAIPLRYMTSAIGDLYTHFVERRTTIKADIKAHQKNIKFLQSFADGRRKLRDPEYTNTARHYQRTQSDEVRMRWSIQHLTNQIYLLQKELAILAYYTR